MDRVIHKIELMVTRFTYFYSNKNIKPLSVGMQDNRGVVWIERDIRDDQTPHKHCIIMVTTGEPIAEDTIRDAKYIGTIQYGERSTLFVAHLYLKS